MSDECDFDLAVRIIGADGVTILADLNDHDAGLSVMRPFTYPEENLRETRDTAPRVDGSFPQAVAFDDSFLLVRCRVRGSSWVQVETRWETVRAAYLTDPVFYLETELAGVTRRWRAERPNVTPEDIDAFALRNLWLTYQLRFRVQPNPTVTV